MFPSSKKLWSTFQVYIDTQLASIVVWQQASEGWLYYREGDMLKVYVIEKHDVTIKDRND